VIVLVDTSVWVAHFRNGSAVLADLLAEGSVLTHPIVIGEIACGNLKDRSAVLDDLHSLPAAIAVSNDEAESLIEDRKLWGRGLGLIDVHLLASALLTQCAIWTLDKKLGDAAKALGIHATTNKVRKGPHASAA
jgi:predicted nucleic acid-binding protein